MGCGGVLQRASAPLPAVCWNPPGSTDRNAGAVDGGEVTAIACTGAIADCPDGAPMMRGFEALHPSKGCGVKRDMLATGVIAPGGGDMARRIKGFAATTCGPG